ncbi:esterase FE4-like, partial [Augochlora pura]
MKVFVFTVIVLLSVENIFADCVVNTTLGLVFGGEIEVESGEIVKAFRGIPYAEPPLGNLRFQDPEPKKPWEGVLNTDKKSCQCKQIVNGEIVGSEDCLYLDVYTPKDKDPNASYAVIVYLHDSYSNCLVSGPDYLLDNRKMVYVCVSYRLSVFGYLSTGDVSAPGNFGLKDQLLALKWVQNNIGAFNGDKNDVTIFGQGSGGESVHLQAISLKSE